VPIPYYNFFMDYNFFQQDQSGFRYPAFFESIGDSPMAPIDCVPFCLDIYSLSSYIFPRKSKFLSPMPVPRRPLPYPSMIITLRPPSPGYPPRSIVHDRVLGAMAATKSHTSRSSNRCQKIWIHPNKTHIGLKRSSGSTLTIHRRTPQEMKRMTRPCADNT
jgi:hypothetical protein